MPELANARQIHAQIDAMIRGDAAALMEVPDIRDDTTADAIHKLQVQVIALSDALTEITAYLVNRDHL